MLISGNVGNTSKFVWTPGAIAGVAIAGMCLNFGTVYIQIMLGCE